MPTRPAAASLEPRVEMAVERLLAAEDEGGLCSPVRDLIGDDLELAYAVQAAGCRERRRRGLQLAGYKVALSSAASQQRMGLTEPVYGRLFDRHLRTGGEAIAIRGSSVAVEGEIAFILARDLPASPLTPDCVASAIETVAVAIEVVAGRNAPDTVTAPDLVADNAGVAWVVLGRERYPPDLLTMAEARMTMTLNGSPVTEGAATECLGHPLNAAFWLATRLAAEGIRLRAGQVVLTGALAPMVGVAPGDAIEVEVSGLGRVGVGFEGFPANEQENRNV